jgi:hypothetical protein
LEASLVDPDVAACELQSNVPVNCFNALASQTLAKNLAVCSNLYGHIFFTFFLIKGFQGVVVAHKKYLYILEDRTWQRLPRDAFRQSRQELTSTPHPLDCLGFVGIDRAQEDC